MGLIAGGLASTVFADGHTANAPLEAPYRHQFNFPTGVTLDKGEADATVGLLHTIPGSTNAAGGTGNQVYFFGFNYGISDRFQLGFSQSAFQDPPPTPINGALNPIRVRSNAFHGTFRVLDNEQWKIAAEASIEHALLRNLTGVAGTEYSGAIGSVYVPISYAPSREWLLTATPGVSFLPDSIGGTRLYGTVASMGFGATWKPTQRFAAYGSVNVPLSGNNTVTTAGTVDQVPVWTVGARFNATPKVALDVFSTNGMGITPATRVLTFFPDGDEALVGAMVTYTPGEREGYRPNYRGLSGEPLSKRQQELQIDGITLSSPDTLSPGRVALTGFAGSENSWSGGIQFSPDYDFQIEAAYEQWSDDGSLGRPTVPGFAETWVVGGTIRLMDQNNGSPFSLAGKVLMGREENNGDGTFFASVPMSYKANDGFALMAEPKAAAWGSTESFGLGLGVNASPIRGLSALAEITPVTEGPNSLVWAAGVRWRPANTGLNLELSASNAVGRYGYGTMVAQDDVKISLGATLVLDGRGLKFW
ncbi:hypothetical protein CLV88_105125 [Shimia abyssi]|uniref:Uncharacterized protein n=1 Tax=Shimia abyssi TaxID=1662395 RepID=A0A2P8FDA1_9RHOB|nr:hypothetical protein CLV88_105125 [Shimia abyssi]